MIDPPSSWFALLEAQSGIVSRRQALAAGFTDHGIVAQLRGGRWQRVVPGVLGVFTGPLTQEHREWVGLLVAGVPGAALSHDSAAFHHGLTREPAAMVHVTVPDEAGARSRGWVVVHRARRPPRVAGCPPVVSLEDALCDVAASWGRDAVAAAVAAALQRRATTPERILRRVRARGRFAGATALRAAVGDVARGAQSALEVRYLRDVERAHGLPRAERQKRARRGSATTYRDVFYRRFRVTVELDGEAFHGSAEAVQRDRARHAAALADGEATLVYGWWDVAEAPCAVAAEVAEVLTSHGWSGVVRRCPSCGGSLRLEA